MKPIGSLIKSELTEQERSVSWFARKLHLDRSNVYRLFQRTTIDTGLLWRVSLVLNKNFFEEFSREFDTPSSVQQSSQHNISSL